MKKKCSAFCYLAQDTWMLGTSSNEARKEIFHRFKISFLQNLFVSVQKMLDWWTEKHNSIILLLSVELFIRWHFAFTNHCNCCDEILEIIKNRNYYFFKREGTRHFANAPACWVLFNTFTFWQKNFRILHFNFTHYGNKICFRNLQLLNFYCWLLSKLRNIAVAYLFRMPFTTIRHLKLTKLSIKLFINNSYNGLIVNTFFSRMDFYKQSSFG